MKLWLGRTVERPGMVIVCARSQVRARELLVEHLTGDITSSEFRTYWREIVPGGPFTDGQEQAMWTVGTTLAQPTTALASQRYRPTATMSSRSGKAGRVSLREGVWLRKGPTVADPKVNEFEKLGRE